MQGTEGIGHRGREGLRAAQVCTALVKTCNCRCQINSTCTQEKRQDIPIDVHFLEQRFSFEKRELIFPPAWLSTLRSRGQRKGNKPTLEELPDLEGTVIVWRRKAWFALLRAPT
eukprot:scaffold161207_cov19-Tisochrysis_lutea.AAC.1